MTPINNTEADILVRGTLDTTDAELALNQLESWLRAVPAVISLTSLEVNDTQLDLALMESAAEGYLQSEWFLDDGGGKREP